MPAFAYRAVDDAGAPSKGVIEAPNSAGARRMLRERALLPLSVTPTKSAPGAGLSGILKRRERISARTLATITRQLSTLISSDVNVEEALRLTAEQAERPTAKALLVELRGAILEGRSLANALGDHPAVFPEYFRASVAAGEYSGRLAEVLAELSDFVETRHRNQQKIQLALLYPALLALVSLGMIAMLLVYVVPDIVRVFVSRGAALPFLTRALITLSDALQSYGIFAGAALLIAMLGARRWLKHPANRLRYDRFLAEMPPFARFVRQHNSARFAASLAMLVQSAVPLVEALHAATAVVSNAHVRQQATLVTTRVREGASLRGAMAEAAIFPSMLVAIVASGESSGKLGPAIARAAAELERELDALVATLVAMVEPGVLLVMGGLVLLMVLAILLPIINLNNLVAL